MTHRPIPRVIPSIPLLWLAEQKLEVTLSVRPAPQRQGRTPEAAVAGDYRPGMVSGGTVSGRTESGRTESGRTGASPRSGAPNRPPR